MKTLKYLLGIIILLAFTYAVHAASVTAEWIDQPSTEYATINEGSSIQFWFSATVTPGVYNITLYKANGTIALYPVSLVRKTTSASIGDYGYITLNKTDYQTYGNFLLKVYAKDPYGEKTHTLSLNVICTDSNNNGICDDDEKPFTGITVTANPNSGTTPLVVNFTCVAQGGTLPITYAWDFGDGTKNNMPNLAHTYYNLGNTTQYFAPICTATDAAQNTIKAGTMISVDPQVKQNIPPIAIATANPQSGYAPLQVLLNGSQSYDPDGRIVSQAWNIDNTVAPISTNPVTTYTFTVPGTYAVHYTVTDDQGAKATTSLTIQATQKPNLGPKALFTVTPSTGYSPLTVSLDASSSYDPDGNIVNYIWYLDNSSAAFAFGITPSLTLNSVGNHTIRLVVVDNQGASDNITHTVEVQQKSNIAPVADFTISSPEGNAPLDEWLNASSSYDPDGTITNYAWYLNANPEAFATGVQTRVMFNIPGNYSVTLVVTDNNGATGSLTKHIQATQRANHPPIINLVDSVTLNENEQRSVVLTVTDPDNDPVQLAINNPYYTPKFLTVVKNASLPNTWNLLIAPGNQTAGTYTVQFRAIDTYAGYSDKNFTIIVKHLNSGPHADFSYSPSNPQVGDTITFDGSLSTDPDNNPLTYAWDFGDGTTSTEQKPQHAYNNPGTYAVTLTVSDGTLTDSITKEIKVTGTLNIDEISCLKEVVVNNVQSCGVKVTANGLPVQNANVVITYIGGNNFGNCTTEKDGSCRAEQIVTQVGNHTVFATATKEGYVNDTDMQPTFTFMVYKERYDIVDLRVYNDSNYQNENYDFYRGQNLYVKFQVREQHTGAIVTDNIIAKATLVSRGILTADLDDVGMDDNKYFLFKLTPIPLKHDFIGTSQVFAFAFNYSDGSGGQKEVQLTIRNNPPQIKPAIDQITIQQGSTYSLDLSAHEFDLEDSGDNLTWFFEGVNYGISVEQQHKTLLIHGDAPGLSYFTVYLRDWDGDTAYQTVYVKVTAQPHNNTAPIVHILSPQNGAAFSEGTSITFSGTATDAEDGNLIPSWYEGNTLLGTGTTITQKLPVGMHTITLSATDSGHLTTTDTVTITVTKTIPPSSNITANIGGPYHAYPNTIITLDGSKSTGNIVNYTFDFGDGNSVTQTSPFAPHTYDGKLQSYKATLIVTGSDGQTAQDSTWVYMKQTNQPTPPPDERIINDLYIGKIDVYGVQSGSEIIQSGEDLAIDLSVENNGESDLSNARITVMIPDLGIKQYSTAFSPDAGTKSTQKIIVPIYDAPPGEYTIKIIVGNGQVIRTAYRWFNVE